MAVVTAAMAAAKNCACSDLAAPHLHLRVFMSSW